MAHRTFARVTALLGLTLALGCRGFDPRGFPDPESLFGASMRALRHGDYADAYEGFNKLSFDLAPGDTLMPKVRYYLAEARFGVGEHLLAARDFRRVADDFPQDSLAAFGLLRAGDAYARLWKHYQLDPSNGETAIATYQELAGRYPDSRAAQLATVRVRELNDAFARKDFENGVFYLKRGAYDSAILYFRGLIAKYPSAALVPEAFVRLVQAYQAIGYREERNETCAHLRQHFGARADVREVCGDGTAGR